MIISSSNATFLSNDFVLYDLQQTDSIGIQIRLTSKEFTENSTIPEFASIFNISSNIVLYYEEAKIFIPGCESQYMDVEMFV